MPEQTASGTHVESKDRAAISSFRAEWWTPRLVWLLIAATAVRLALLAVTLVRFGSSALIYADTTSYLEPGRNLLLHGRFFANGVADLVRTPGYPLFLAVTSLFGLPTAAVGNVILSVFCVFLVWKLGRVVSGDDRIALGAAWIFAFEPVSLIYSYALMSECLFLVLLLLSMERLAVFLRRRRLRVLVAAGLWLAAATFVRPITLYLPAALAAGLFLALARVPGLRWKAPAVLLVSALPWLAAWQIRNFVETGYSGFSSAGEINLYFQGASGVTARVEHRPFLDVRRETGYIDFTHNSGQDYLYPPYLALHPEQVAWNQGQRLAFLHAQALRIIRAHFWVYLSSCLTSILRTVFIPGEQYFDQLLYPGNSVHDAGMAFKDQSRWTILPSTQGDRVEIERAVFAAGLLGMYLLALRGVFFGNVQQAHRWMLLGILLYFLCVTAAGEEPGGNMRFRLPIMPIVCILAAAGFPRKKIIAETKTADTYRGEC
jgi:hypothetical protein